MDHKYNDTQAGWEQMAHLGEQFTRNFFEFAAKQNKLWEQMGGQIPGPLPLPDPAELLRLQQEFVSKHAALWASMSQRPAGQSVEPVIAAPSGDRRFNAESWTNNPMFDYVRQAYWINSQFTTALAKSLPISDARSKERFEFLTRQFVDAMAPSNFAATNPEFIQTALDTNGESIQKGIQNMLEDLQKGRISMTDETAFEIGRNIAVTPGAVVYENALMQLIQYSPQTDKVFQTPLLIVPPCINKYYIMDLQPDNSFVRFALEEEHSVFLISWKNPKAPEAQTTWDDMVALGPLTALEVVRKITKVEKPNALGFCIGGTLLVSALAVARARGQDPVGSLTLMATLLDFAEPGELGCLVDPISLTAREAAIGQGGLLSGQEMANVFSALRANDLIWQYVVANYLKGEKPKAFDLLYWNADATNIPGPFLVWYLRSMYLENNLRTPGKLRVLGEAVDLTKINVPTYLMGAREDHIVPWKGAYLSRAALGTDTTFVLGASGHIAGTINSASKNRRSYWTNDAKTGGADNWLAGAQENPGSWWRHWVVWLKDYSGKQIAARKTLGNAAYKVIEPAPGRYVKERA